ncbi:transient receptor potential cation channel subfamily M member 6-like isoform X1 [Rhopilema esculentum]|uniref:transient receptor potential cation channel subfamily M member 6-like isoform X1 n=1 Tax=Rhopilema esculentum TaxID=499914 RepID=UPI0031DEF8FE
MSEGKSWVDKAVQLTSSKKRGSLYHQEAIEEPIISFQKAGDRPPMVSGVSNSSYSFDSPISHRVSYAANERSVRKARTTSSILSPFKKKTCIYYFENEEKLGFCKCGRPKSDHSKDAIKNANFQWNIKKHIKSCKTNAYGEVEFHGTNRKTRAKYIRVSDETDAKDALKLLLREWKLEYPNFLVSVTGGAKTFKLPVKLKHLFSNGLYKVAQTSGAWVITGGTNTGVMKHVGEALQIASNTQYGTQGDSNRRVYCIGIATWGIVENRNLLTNTRGTVKYYMKNSIEAAGACLDNNHTHFFLVDNGTVNQYGKEIQFRARLEKQIMKMEVDKNRGKVPAVLLVLEGGPNTVATVYEAITNDPAVPVIVIKDSGRAADLLAYAHNISHGEGTFYYMGDVVEHKQLFKRIEQTYPELNQEGCLKVYGNVLKCVERKHLITIFEMEEGTADLDQAILKALLKSKSASPEEQLKLALLWNRPDVARAQIFSEELKWPLSSLESAMKVALAKDRTEFVELLLEQGVSMGNFLTRDRLDSLYSTRARERKSMLRYMLDKAKFGAVTLRDAESLFYTLTGLSLNPQQQQTHRTVPHAIAHIVPLNTRDALHQSFHHPFNQLFVWAVLNNMQKMALCFWKHGEEPMAKALVACKLYFALAKYADKRDMKDDIMETLTTNGEEFQRLAVQLLDHCFVTDESRSSKLMTYELRNWGNTTNLNLAVTSGHTLFVAHSCNQELLTDIWSGVMTLRTLKSLKTVLCMFCPPLVLCLSFRTKREVLKMPQTEGMLDEFSFREEDEEDAPVTNVEIEEGLGEKKGDLNLKRNETFSSSFDDSILGASERDADTVMSAEMVKTQSLSYLEKYRGFYTAPITKFWGNVLAYLVFLGLFTYVLLGKLEKTLSNTEIVVIVFVISMTTEEIRQVLKSDTGRLYKKVYEWSRSKWNLCDGLAIFLFYIGLGLRLNPSTVSAGRVVLAVDIMFWIIRLLDIFSVNQNLGPYVVIIGKMTIDLAYFLFIMAVFLLAYGVARQTILEPNKPVSWKSVAEIFFVPYFQVYGELFIDKEHLYSNNLTYFGTTKHNDYSEPAVSLLMAFYLLIANILLLNLLIAIFNNTFSKVQVNSNQIWKFQRYHLILEYARRPPLVPPFVFLNHMFSVLSWAYNQCRRSDCCGGHQNESSFKTDRKIKIYPSSAELDDLMQFEGNCLADFLHKRKNAFLSSKEEKGRLVLEKIDNISWRLEEFKRETWTREERIDTKMLKVQHKLEEFSKSLSKALTVLTDKQSGMGDKVRSNSIPASGMQHVPMKSSAPAASVNGLGRTPPTMRRFLSQNPYMHHPAYDQTLQSKKLHGTFGNHH